MATITKYRNGVPNWADVASTDVPAAVDFYTNLFGWTADDQGPDVGGYHLFLLDGAPVAGLGPAQGAGGAPLWSTYLAVDDLDAVLAATEEAGGTVVAPRMDVLTAGSMAIVSDSSGAVVSFWQAVEHIGAQLVNQDNTVVWNELTTRDAEAAMSFYRRVLGCEFVPMDTDAPAGYQMMMVGDRVVAGVMPMEGEEWGDLPSHWMTYFGAADVDAMAQRVKELGGSVSVEPFDIPVGRIAVVNDPTGAGFSMIQFAGEVDTVPSGIA